MSIRPLLATKNYLCKSVRSVGDQEGSGQDEQGKYSVNAVLCA